MLDKSIGINMAFHEIPGFSRFTIDIYCLFFLYLGLKRYKPVYSIMKNKSMPYVRK